MPVVCALVTVALAAMPFGVEQLDARFAVPAAFVSAAVFVIIAVRWKRLVRWAWGRDLAPHAPSSGLQAADQQIWNAIFRMAVPAYLWTGVGLPAKFMLRSDPNADVALKLSALGVVVIVLAWFAPLWSNKH